MRNGHTLLELCVTLLLLSICASVTLRSGRGLRDAMAATGAREALAGLVAEARLAALAHGGATVYVEAHPPSAWSQVGDSTLRVLPLGDEWGVTLLLSPGRTSGALRYDAMGVGRVASETIRLRRGGAERSLVISGYGRLRRP